jgi:hypothetical protein
MAASAWRQLGCLALVLCVLLSLSTLQCEAGWSLDQAASDGASEQTTTVHANGGENRKLGLQAADDGYARKAHNIRKPRLEKIVFIQFRSWCHSIWLMHVSRSTSYSKTDIQHF